MMSGISTQPIGFDDEGRCYWQFPHISTLFISPRANRDHEQDKEALRRQINSDFQESRLDSSAADNWYAISDSKEITTLIESLGPSAAEQHLKKSLSLRFAEMNSSTHRQGAESKVDSENEISPATGTIEDKESVSDNQDSIKTSKRDKPERESVKRKGEGKPVALKLIPEKGATMQSTFVIKEENVFGNRENDGDDDYSSDDDESYLEYFSFAKPARYYAIAFVDCYDKVVKQDKSSRVTIVFQIQKEGLAHSIAETPLSEPWSDGMYYFSTLSFKRSGKYTISFFAEGAQLSHLQPLVFVVNVFANSVVSGPSSALRRLRAQEYIDHPDRHVTYKRRELIQLLTNSDDEFSAIKTALLTIYLALPLGSLIMSEDDDSGLDTFSQVATGAGWNGQLDTLWRNCVVETRSSTVLMECTLLLECYISKNWFMSPANRLISSLPNPHFAIRCVTNSSIALRLFCLDKCLGYDRVQAKSKSGGSITVSQATSRKSRSNGRSDIPQDVLAEYTARPKRAAMAKAREALSETVKFHFDEDSDNEGGSRRNLRTRPARPEWNCSECGTTNDERNRSCSECGGRKRAASVVTTTHLSRAERLASRKRALYGSDESSADTNSSSDEERDDNSDDEPRASRRKHTTSNLEAHSLRKRSRVSYREAEEDDEGDEDSTENGNYSTRGSNKRGRDNKSSHSDDYSEYIPPTPLDIDALLVTRKSEIGDMDPSEDIPYALLTILKKIQDDPESIPFWEPVDTTIYTDYRFISY